MNAWPRITIEAVPSRLRPHWSESGLQAAVVGFDPVVGVVARVVEPTGHEIFDRSGECMGLVGGDLDRVAVVADRRRQEPGRGLRDLCEGLRDLALGVSGSRPPWAGRRGVGLQQTRHGGDQGCAVVAARVGGRGDRRGAGPGVRSVRRASGRRRDLRSATARRRARGGSAARRRVRRRGDRRAHRCVSGSRRVRRCGGLRGARRRVLLEGRAAPGRHRSASRPRLDRRGGPGDRPGRAVAARR